MLYSFSNCRKSENQDRMDSMPLDRPKFAGTSAEGEIQDILEAISRASARAINDQIQIRGPGYALRQAVITVCEAFDGTVPALQRSTAPVPPVMGGSPSSAAMADEESVLSAVDGAKAEQTSRPLLPKGTF